MNTTTPKNQASDNQVDDMEVFRLLDEVCENGDAALPQLESYLETVQDSEAVSEIDVEASLAKFKATHAAFFAKPRRVRRWGYRVCVAAATVVVANTVCAFALGHSLFDYVAKWSAETFGFYHNDFATSEDGKIIYYPDGTWEDRSAMPDYDHKTYTALPEKNTAANYDPSSPAGSEENPQSADTIAPLEEYAALPDTDLSDTGLQKSLSSWDEAHTTEWFDIENASLQATLSALNIHSKLAPSWLPDGYMQTRIKMTKDHLLGSDSLIANYANKETDSEMFVMVSKITEATNATIEKDDRAVLEYTPQNVTWYIMHNLQQLNAVAMVDNYEVLISGDLSVDEMKDIIDSIYKITNLVCS